MILRFRSGVRVFWSNANTITVLARQAEHFSHPTHNQLRVLHSLQIGIPSSNLDLQASITEVSATDFMATVDRLAGFVISSESEPKTDSKNRKMRSSEENRSELLCDTAGWQTSQRRNELQIRLSGISSAVWLAHQYFELAGIDSVFSKRGRRLSIDPSPSSGWDLTHKLGFNPSRQLSLSIGFFFEVVDADVHHYWISRGLPHLAVIFDAGGFRVSRIVIPGVNTCLDCDPEMQPRGGLTKPILKSQATTFPLAYDDAVTLAQAMGELIKRALDYADQGDKTKIQNRQEQLTMDNQQIRGEADTKADCGCLIDLVEPIGV